MFGSPAFMFRQKMILKKFKDCGAISEESAKTLEEAGVFNPDAFSNITEDLVNKFVKICKYISNFLCSQSLSGQKGMM